MIAIAKIDPPTIKNREDEWFFLPFRERREGDVCDDLRAMIGLNSMLNRHLRIWAGAKKAWVSVLVARPTIGGFSHCLLELDGNAEAHAWICEKGTQRQLLTEDNAEYCVYISTGIYRCFIPDSNVNFARIPDSQESSVE